MDSLSHLIEQFKGLETLVDGHLILGLALLLDDHLGLGTVVGRGLGYWNVLGDSLLVDLLLLHDLLLRLVFGRVGLGVLVTIGGG